MLINTLPRMDYWNVIKEPSLGIPMGLLSIASVLHENGYQIKIVDPVVDRNYLDIIGSNLDDCLYVGVSAMTAGVASGLEISRFIKSLNPAMPIIWGGIHPTLLPEQTLANNNIDFICWGDGEYTALELANSLKNGLPLDRIEGLGLKQGNKFITNVRKNFHDPNTLPFLNYELLDMNKYLYRDAFSLTGTPGKAKIFVLNSGLGCPYRCTFCINTHPSQKYRPKTLERLTAEVDNIVALFDPDIIHIQDDLFFAVKSRVLGFLDHYENKNYRFKWFTLTRANYFRDDYMSDEFIKRIKGSCFWLGLGIESGSDAVRRRLRKEISEGQIERAVKTLADNKVATGYAFMFGMPRETREEMAATAKLIFKLKKRHPEASFAYQFFRPYPGTELFDEAVKLGYKIPSSLQDWASLQDIETGYTAIKEADWISEKRTVRYFQDAVSCSLLSIRGSRDYMPIIRIYLLIFKLVFSLWLKLRLLINFWRFTIEDDFYQISRSVFIALRKGWRRIKQQKT
jgi:anaerobic magnesium-protoporphyrin IX monomethyl ester cyclase